MTESKEDKKHKLFWNWMVVLIFIAEWMCLFKRLDDLFFEFIDFQPKIE